MSTTDVTNFLKELDADPTKSGGSAAGDRKARLKEVIGVGERGGVVGALKENTPLLDGVAVDKVDGVAKVEKEKKQRPLPGKATGPPPGKVLPIGPKG